MTTNLEKFLVELAIGGINNITDPIAKREFDLELKMRSHILGRKLSWNNDKKSLIVEVVIESINETYAAKQMAEEMFEVANAVLRSVDGLNVRVITSRQLKPGEDL